MEQITKYFPGLTARQCLQLEQLGPLYAGWNAKINVISRKDIENLYERHVLHALGIAKVISFHDGTRVLDAGTGGGFPGIPLAILFPACHFHMVDSTAKKLRVVQAIADETGLKNVTTEHARLEDHTGQYDFVVSRAVATLDQMISWVWKNVGHKDLHDIPNGILYLKGGDVSGVNRTISSSTNSDKPGNFTIYELRAYFTEPFFETKTVVHLF